MINGVALNNSAPHRTVPRPDFDFDPLRRCDGSPNSTSSTHARARRSEGRTILDWINCCVKYSTVLQTQVQTVTKQGAYYSESPR
jgi:hypothetical protein